MCISRLLNPGSHLAVASYTIHYAASCRNLDEHKKYIQNRFSQWYSGTIVGIWLNQSPSSETRNVRPERERLASRGEEER